MFPPDPRIALFVVFGLAIFLARTVEKQAKRFRLNLPILYVAIGWAVFSLPLGLPGINPVVDQAEAKTVEYVTEFLVIASLMGAGLAIDRPLSWKQWRQVWPLLVLTMPLTIIAVALMGWLALGLVPASAILLGAVLSPTDPVLASSVQVGPPGESKRHDVRFSLTVEAGINDGLAFPFTHLALTLAAVGLSGLSGWFLEDFLWRIGAGVAVGVAVGLAGAWFVFERGEDVDESEEGPYDIAGTNAGLIVFGSLLLAYGLAEVVHGYGFLAVFVGAVVARQRQRKSRYHELTHHFMEQIEEIVLICILIGFGGLLASGILDTLTWQGVVVALALVLVIRPVTGIIGQIGCGLPWAGRLAIAFLGIRGVGSIYYLAYGQTHGEFAQMDVLWSVLAFTILLSIVLHGITAPLIMRAVEKRNEHQKTDTEY